MKILIINAHDGSGGAAIACKRLHIAFLEQGYDTKLLVVDKKSGIKEIYSIIKDEFIVHKLVRRVKQILFNFRFYRQYKNKPKGHYLHTPTPSVFDITKHELYDWADVINLHWVSGFVDFPSFFSKKTSKPIFWTLHDMNPFTGGCHHAEDCEGFKLSCQNCPQLSFEFQQYNHQNWVNKSKSNFQNLTIITPSLWLQNQSISSSLFKNLSHFVMPNAVDIKVFKIYDKQFCKSVFNIPQSNKTLLFVAQNVSMPLKGIQYLIDNLNEFADNISILVVGKNDIDFASKNVISLGTIDDERLLALLYNAADVFVLPSLAENLPNVIIESLSCGTPVVAFNIGGIPELITDGENGFLVGKENTKSLFENIKKALVFDWNNVEISKKAHAFYNYEKQVKAYYELFEKTASIANPI
jgi:glycosyltransferase involved in cell wall biosynthesis